MADAQEPRRGDPHDWNSLANYVFLHEKHFEEHPLISPGSSLNIYLFPTPDALYDLIVVEGIISCINGLELEISKSGAVDRTAAQRVRMNLYSYNAWWPGGHNVLRYDNQLSGRRPTRKP